MFKNYLKTAYRNLLRNKSYSIINVLGLSLGIACSLTLFLLIRHELSFDTFHSKADRIYRVVTQITRDGETNYMSAGPAPLGEALRNEYPEIEQLASVFYWRSGLVKIEGKNATDRMLYQETDGITFLEPSYFKIFDVKWIEGSATSLEAPYTVVLSQSLAKKYFGNEPAMGKTLMLNNKLKLSVTGVVEDMPVNTDFPFTFMISDATRRSEAEGDELSNWQNLSTSQAFLVLLKEGQDPAQLEAKFPEILKKNLEPEEAARRAHFLQPLSDVHFNNRYFNFSFRIMEKETLWALGIIGAGLLITACINFINMATAQAIKRSREVGVRKVLGSSREQLFWQFMGETAIITLAAVMISVCLTELLLPYLNQMLDLKVALAFNLTLIAYLLATAVLVTFLSGSYPALILAGYQPVLALKGKVSSSGSGSMSLRRGLVVAQFAISQALIIGTVIVFNQMELFRNAAMGFDKEAVITVPLPENNPDQLKRFGNYLAQQSGIKNFTFGFTSAASEDRWITPFRHRAGEGVNEHLADIRMGDANYVKTYGIELVAGRFLSESDTVKEFLINESMAKKMGFLNPSEAVGQVLLYGRAGKSVPIVGVTKDFNFLPLRERMEPVVMSTDIKAYQEASIKIIPQNAQQTIQAIQQAWQEIYPDYLFSHEFLDDRLAGFYQAQERMSNLFKVFSGIAIFIGCLGLYGLVSFMATQRTKEIGIRKVLGASSTNIVMLFTKEYAKLLGVAFVIAAPLAWYVMQQWLNDFAFRIEIGPDTFLTAGAVTLVIASITVGYKSVKTAVANPVNSLRSE